MLDVLPILAHELERPREVLPQVAKHIAGTYGVARDAIGAFFLSELPKLEDYEIDLILSPIFTPTLKDQAVIAEHLGTDSVSREQWPNLIARLVARPTKGALVTENGVTHQVQLREVSISRYVNRLCLDTTIPESLFKLLTQRSEPVDRPLLKAVARRNVWQADGRREILMRYLVATVGVKEFSIADTLELLHLVETYQPTDTTDLLAHIPKWQHVIQHEINLAVNPKPFFSERIQELHGGGRDQRLQDDVRITAKEAMIARLERLKSALKE